MPPLSKIYILLFLNLLPTFLTAQSNYKSEAGFRSDNDAYLATRQDRYYTNGLFLQYRHAALDSGFSVALAKKIYELEIGQKMYNSRSGRGSDIDLIDRPFAGYLYAGGGISWLYKNERVLKANVQAGIVGPAALGETAQKFLHHTFGFYEISGWEYQIKNEFQVNTSVNYTSLIGRDPQNKADVLLNTYANAGTTFTGAGVGATIRIGEINSLFNSAITNSRISNSLTDTVPHAEFFFFAQPMLHVIGYDATVSGGLFREDKGPVIFETKPVVFSQELGFAYAADKWSFNFSVIFKTKEIKSPALHHQYASFSTFYRF